MIERAAKWEVVMRLGLLIGLSGAFLSMLGIAQAEDVSLKAGDSDGIVVIGVVSGKADPFSIRLSPYVAETKKTRDGFFGGRVTVEHQGAVDQMIYHVIPTDTGTYVFKSVHSTSKGQEMVECMGKGTVSFDVRPGEAIYLGDYSAFGGGLPRKPMDPTLERLRQEFPDSFISVAGLKRLPDKFDAAQAALAQQPRVSVELKPTLMRDATFESGRNSCG